MDLNEYISSQSDQDWDGFTELDNDSSSITIQTPIWKTLSVGISEALVKNKSGVFVEIAFKDPGGRRLWPDEYYISKEKLLTYPIKEWKGLRLRIVPIEHLKRWKQ